MNWPRSPELQRYTYERGEGRKKHKWKHDRAGFMPGARGPVGKCHRSIDEDTALERLHTGVVATSPYDDDPDYPDQVFNVYRGVSYVAVPTNPGRSYHGYPWRGRLPASVRRALRQRAADEGHERAFDDWMREYGHDR